MQSPTTAEYTSTMQDLEIAVAIPCLNEVSSIRSVVRAFAAALPNAVVFVYDNDSTDATINEARLGGAIVRCECRRGKGNVVRRMFADIDADVYVLCDGDDTYDASDAARMAVDLVENDFDMVSGIRVACSSNSYRAGHQVGNQLLSRLVQHLFGCGCSDVLSGYRVLSRRFVKSFPAVSHGFEIETELTIHALSLRMPVGERVTQYRSRGEGSTSKLRTFRDGFAVLRTIADLYKWERPLRCLTLVGLITSFLAWLLFELPIISFALLGYLVGIGLILDAVSQSRREARRLSYLGIPSVRGQKRARRKGAQ